MPDPADPAPQDVWPPEPTLWPQGHWWSPDYELLVIGGPDHQAYLGLYLTLLVLLLTKKDLVRRRRDLVRAGVAAAAIAQQLAMYGYHLHHGQGLAESLPLHLCRVATLLELLWLAVDEDAVMDLVFFLGLYAYGSLAYPVDIARTDHAMGWSFAVNHVITLLLPVFAAVSGGWRPTATGLARAYGIFLVYLGAAEAANRRLGSNYFYLRDKPVLAHLPHRTYLAAAAGVTLGVFGAAYAVARRLTR